MSEDEVGGGFILSTGPMQRVDGLTEDRFEKELAYCIKSGTHMWCSFVQYFHSVDAVKQAFDKDGELLLMDRENLVGHAIGCYICEEPATRNMLDRRCKGEPKGQLRRV